MNIDKLLNSCFSNSNFHTDYCSGGLSYIWGKLLKSPCPYNYYCVIHDCRYFKGTLNYDGIFKEFKDRLKADIELFKNIWNHDKDWYDKYIAIIVFIALRLFGWRVWIFHLRKNHWGYGKK